MAKTEGASLALRTARVVGRSQTTHRLKLSISAAIYDSGHDGRGIYHYLLAKQIDPVIVLNPRRGLPMASGTAQQINSDGIPVSPAGLLKYAPHPTPDSTRRLRAPARGSKS